MWSVTLRALGIAGLALAAGIIAAAEALVAGLGLVLSPVEVTTAEIRQFLPITIGYDLLLCPFATASATTRIRTRSGTVPRGRCSAFSTVS